MPAEPETPTADPPGAPASSTAGPRRLFLVAFAAAIVGLAVTLSFGFADHDPKPHGVAIAVVAPASVQSQLAAGLDRVESGGFRLVSAPSEQAAEQAVHAQTAAGGLVVAASGANTIVVGGAQGTLESQTITKALTAASTLMHRGVNTVDVAPLAAGDKAGLGTFVFELGLLIPSVIGSIGLFLLGMRYRLWWRVSAALAFAVMAALGGTLAMDTIFGSLTGNGGALIGVGILGAASFVLFIAACQAAIGLPGTALAAIAFIFTGNAISGGSVPVGFLPDVFRQIAPWLPNNAIVRAIRDVIYYQGTDLGHPMLVFGLWIGVSVILLIAVDILHLRARAKAPQLAAEIYRTPGLVHLKQQFGAGARAAAGPPSPAVVAPTPASPPPPASEPGPASLPPASESASAQEPVPASPIVVPEHSQIPAQSGTPVPPEL